MNTRKTISTWAQRFTLSFGEGWGEVVSVIGGGRDNNIFDDVNVIGGGEKNTINIGAQHSFIGGGIGNTVNGSCAVIAGGRNNTATGADSAILGGNGNNDGGLANVHIAGSGIAAVNANTLHVNALWANAIPGPFAAVPLGLPLGTVYFGPAGVPGGNVLYIR